MTSFGDLTGEQRKRIAGRLLVAPTPDRRVARVALLIISIPILSAATFFCAAQADVASYVWKSCEIREGAAAMCKAIMQARVLAVHQGTTCFLVLSPEGQDGWIELHLDADRDGVYDGDHDVTSPDDDPVVEGGRFTMSSGVGVERSPAWVAFLPTGELRFPAAHRREVDNFFGLGLHYPADIHLRVREMPYRACFEMDPLRGRIARHYFVME